MAEAEGESKFITVNLGGKDTPLELLVRGPPLNAAKLRRLEVEIKFPLPADYREFLEKYNGGITIYTALTIDGNVQNGIERYFSVDDLLRIHDTGSRIPEGALPIGVDAGTCFYYMMLTGPDTGGMFFYDADMYYRRGSISLGLPAKIISSFTEFLNSVTTFCDEDETENPADFADAMAAMPEPFDEKPAPPRQKIPAEERQLTADFSPYTHSLGALPKMDYYGYLSDSGYVRVVDYIVADGIITEHFGQKMGPLYRHKHNLCWEYGPDTKIKSKVMNSTMLLVQRDACSVIWGGLPHMSGVTDFYYAVTAKKVLNNDRHFQEVTPEEQSKKCAVM